MLVFTFVPLTLFFAFATAQNPNDAAIAEELKNSPDTIYLITTPQLYSNNEENVCIVFFKKLFPSQPELNVQLKSPETRRTIYETKKTLTERSECVTVSLKDVITSQILLQVLVGNVINDTRIVNIQRRTSFSLIEVPKNTYEPGEEIEFRLFSFNQWLKPVEEDFEVIWIEDSSFVPIMQWTNVLNSKGLLSYKLQLSEDCNVGLWRIKALSKKQRLTEKTFAVNRIVKPRISINAENTKYLLPSEKERVLNICIENEFGYPLTGELDVLVGYRRALVQHIDHSLPIYTNTTQVNDDGCVEITLNRTALKWDEVSKLNVQSLNVFVEFMENKTGFSESKTVDFVLAQHPIRIAFPSPNLVHHYFKPGLPYFTYILVENPDFTPVANEEFNVCYDKRIIPWIDTDKDTCKSCYSDSQGVILLDIPAAERDISQILIRITSAKYEDVVNIISLDSWFTTATSSMTIKPLHEPICKGPLNLEVFISNDTRTERTLYYQFMGPNSLQAPQTAKLSLKPYIQQLPEGQKQLMPVMNGVLSIPLPSSVSSYSILDRVVLYYVSDTNRLVSDSTAFFVDCLNTANIGMKMKYENPSKVEVQLENKPDDSVCAVDISSHNKRKEITKRRMMHLLETFNVVLQPDSCHKKKMAQILRRNTPYTQNFLPQQPPIMPTVIDLRSAWDSFNEIGIYVSSNSLLDDSPCEDNLFRSGIPQNVLEGFTRHQRIMGLRFTKQEMNNALLARLEREVTNDALHSSVSIETKNSLNTEHSKKIYGNAICVSKTDGINFVSSQLDPATQFPITISIELPAKTLSIEEIPVNIYIHKEVEGCVPVQINIEKSPKFTTKQAPSAQCVCKETMVTAIIKPRIMGKFPVQVTAKPATVSSNFNCNDIKVSTFTPFSKIETAKVFPVGVSYKEYNTTVYCSEDKLPFSLKKNPSFKKATITADLTNFITFNLKEKQSNSFAFDLLPRIAFVANALNSPDVKIGDDLKKSLLKELAKDYQELATYRVPDGSFSVTRRRDFSGGVPLTVEAFKIMTELRKAYLKPIRELELQRTLQWIISHQEHDGCFYQYISNANVWPNNLGSTLETTAFVVASLLESGLNITADEIEALNPLNLAFQCIKSQLLIGKYSDLTLAMLAYIGTLRSDSTEANKRLNELVGRAVVADNEMYWNSENNKEVASYAILAFLKVQENEKAVKVARWLVQQPKPLDTSVASSALIEILPLFSASSGLKFKIKNRNAVAFSSSSTQNIPMTSDVEAELEGKGCAILHVDKTDKFAEESKTNFEITINRLEEGFSTCHKRVMRLCVKEIGKKRFNSTIIKVSYESGFNVDERALIPRLTSRPVISDFQIKDSYLLLYLRPFYNVPNQECFDIPFNQRQIIPNSRPGYIQAYDYFDQKSDSNHFSDVVKYFFPKECNVTKEVSHTKTLQENSQNVRRIGSEQFDSLESRVFDCPEGVKDSCPDCRSTHHHQYKNAICRSSLAAVVDRSSLRKSAFDHLMTYGHPSLRRHESKKCVAVPMRVRKLVHMNAEGRSAIHHSDTLHFFVLEDCKCEFITKQSKGEGLAIVDNWQHKLNTPVNLLQLTDKDFLINLPLGESRFPKCD